MENVYCISFVSENSPVKLHVKTITHSGKNGLDSVKGGRLDCTVADVQQS